MNREFVTRWQNRQCDKVTLQYGYDIDIYFG